MLETIDKFLVAVDDFVWGIPLIVLILATGLILTVRLKGIQVTKFGLAVKHLFANDKEGEGEVSSFGALCTALSATIGTGNIVGVATAIVAGGPGALFWMWVAAIVGTATKYAECLLAIKYRVVTEEGHVIGGPFYYIENGMGKNWKWLAKIFAFLGVVVGLFGIGTFTQINGITSAVNNFFDPNNNWAVPFTLFGNTYSWSVVIAGILLTICVALVLIGGIKRISKVAEFVVPFMALIYVVAALLIIIFNIKQIPAAFVTIVESAFGLRAVAGGALGAMIVAMQKGIARGIKSHDNLVFHNRNANRKVSTIFFKPADIIFGFHSFHHGFFHNGLNIRGAKKLTFNRSCLCYPELSVFWNILFPWNCFCSFKKFIKGSCMKASNLQKNSFRCS